MATCKCGAEISERYSFTVCTPCSVALHVEATNGETRAEWNARIEQRREARLKALQAQAKGERHA